MNQTPSLANPPVHTTSPGNLCLAPLNGILLNTSQYLRTYTSMSTSKVLRGTNISANSKHSDTSLKTVHFSAIYLQPQFMSLASGIMHDSIIPTWFDSPVLDFIRLTGSWLDSARKFLTWSDPLVPELIQLTSHLLDSTRWFLTWFKLMVTTWFHSLFPTRFNPRLLNGFDSFLPTQLDSLFLTGFNSDFPRFDSTHIYRNYFWFKSNYFIPIPVRLQGVPHYPGCLWNNPRLKSWNIPQFW